GDHGTAVAASGADDPESIQRLVGDIFFPISEEMNIIQSLVMSWRMIREEKTMVEEIFVDGSPSGHMLRALSFPFRMHEYLGRLGKMVAAVRKAVIFDAKRREMLDRRAAMAVTFNSFMSVLSQPAISTTILVSIPETMALAETWRTLLSLDELKVPVSNLILNKIHDRDGTSKTCCPFCNERIQNEASIIAETEARARARNLAFTRVPLLAREIHGIPALVSLGRQLLDQGRDACPEITTKASLF
ncbi:MAG: hypothetical protein GYA24_07140, partial [Candidatus Lokiarchaeota archaeon]|nr:hypothetical protein [Candidatus Lokiarchaeota archaeon]